MNVKVALFRGNVSAISKLIEWDTRSPYCHAGIVLRSGQLIESVEPSGVRMREFVQDSDEPADLFTVAGVDDDKVEKFLIDQLGKPYAMLNIVGFLIRDNKDEDRGKWFCSELVFAAIEAGGVSLLRDIPPYMVSPAMLALSPLLKPDLIWVKP